jgi:hypothetical protein
LKKEAKSFAPRGFGICGTATPAKQKFFAAFFQKEALAFFTRGK